MGMATGDGWLRALRGEGEAVQGEPRSAEQELADMADFIHRSLARGFGKQFSQADLQDLTQDALLRVHDKHPGFTGDSRFSTWVASVAVNGALSELRRRRHQHVELDQAAAAGERALRAPASDRLQRAQSHSVLMRAIDEALTDRQRTALLAELGGLPLAEVARRLQSQRGAVYKLLHDARKRLRAHLEAQGLGPSDLLTEEPREQA